MQINDLQRKTKRVKHRQVGRGGKRGKTSGRGTKGQKARAGRKLRPEIRDMIKKLPKLRGRGINANKSVNKLVTTVSLSSLELNFQNGEVVTPKILADKKVIRRIDGRVPSVKILATGELTKKLTIKKCIVSGSAKEKILATGGSLN